MMWMITGAGDVETRDRMDSVAEGTGPESTSGERSPLAQLLIELIRGLDAFRREVRLYDAGHPRIANRLDAIHHLLTCHLDARQQPVILQVRGGTLYSQNLPIDEASRPVAALASLLKERMIQLVEIQPGVQRDEIVAFVQQILKEEPAAAGDDSHRLPLGGHVTLHLFEPSFQSVERPLSQEEILARALRSSAPGGMDSGTFLVGREWSTFGTRQLEGISTVLSDHRVQGKLQSLQRHFAKTEDGKNVLPLLFTTLQKDPRTDWGNLRRLADLVLAGLSLLEDGNTAVRAGGNLPAALIGQSSNSGDLLASHTRWLLLRNFFPGMNEERSPREAEDLSFLRHTAASDAAVSGSEPATVGPDSCAQEWAGDETSGDEWGRTDPRVLEKPFREQFRPAVLLGECAVALVELARTGNAIEAAASLQQFQTLLAQELDGATISPQEIECLTEPARSLDSPAATQWRLAALRHAVHPKDAIQAVAGDAETANELLQSPGSLRETGLSQAATRAGAAWHTLRQLLVEPSYPSLAVAHSALADVRSAGALGPWGKLARELCSIQAGADVWVEENLRSLLDPLSIPFLLALPPNLIHGALIRFFDRSGVSSFQAFLDLFRDRPAADATRLSVLGFSLKAPTARLATIRALGRQSDPRSLRVLDDQLQHANLVGVDATELDALVGAIRNQGNAAALACLERVVSERTRWFRRKWARPLRQAASRALSTWVGGADR